MTVTFRKKIRNIFMGALSLILISCERVSAVPSEVFDPLVYTLCEKLLTSLKALKEVQKEIISGVSRVGAIMGQSGTFNYGAITGYVNQAKSLGASFARLTPSSIAIRPRETTEALRARLGGLIRLGSIEEGGQERHQHLMAQRDGLVSEMTLNALTLSLRSQPLIEDDYKQLGDIINRASQTHDLRSDVAMTNHLLMLLVHETIQLRVAFTNMLGVVASDTLRHSPLLLQGSSAVSTPPRDFPWDRLV